MDYDSKYFSTRSLIGVILILIGGLMILGQFGIIHAHMTDIVFSFPGLVIFIGLVNMINSRHKLLGILITIAGIILIIPKINPYINYDEGTVFSIFLIMFGIYIISRRRGPSSKRFRDCGPTEEQINDWKEKNREHFESRREHFENRFQNYEKRGRARYFASEVNDDRIDNVAVFGGGKQILHSDNFQGGTITAIFGGSEIDLTQCKLAPGENYIDVLAIFGGTTIFVPKDWKVIVNVFPLFGGFSIKGKKDPSVDYDPTRALIIKGTVIFGGGEIKIEKY